MIVRAVPIATWLAYSAIQRLNLKGGTYGSMQFLSEMRTDGDPNNLKKVGRKSQSVPGDWVLLRQSKPDTRPIDEKTEPIVRRSKQWACSHDEAKNTMSLFGPKEKLPSKTIREIIRGMRRKDFRPLVEEDVYQRILWEEALDKCSKPCTAELLNQISGDYSFLYRDYVNHEELLSMLLRRWTVENVLIHTSRTGTLKVLPEGECILEESARLFGVLPFVIRWDGIIREAESCIEWTSTCMDLGWKHRFLPSLHFDKPAASEKLRQENWEIRSPPEEEHGDICVFYRIGIGKVVYARDSLIAASFDSKDS